MSEKNKGGVKHNTGKAMMSLLPPWATRKVADALTYGAEVYGLYNWMLGLPYHELMDATYRHLNSFWMGEENDPDSKLPHLAHAAASILMLLELTKIAPQYDDRPCSLDRSEFFSLKPSEFRERLFAEAEVPIEAPKEHTMSSEFLDFGKDELASPPPAGTNHDTEISPPLTEQGVLVTDSMILPEHPPWVVALPKSHLLRCERCCMVFAKEAVQRHYSCEGGAKWSPMGG